MNVFTFQKALLSLALAGTDSTSAAGPLAGLKIRLFQEDINIGGSTSIGTLNDASATFTGYGDQTITWAAPSISEDGAVEVIGSTPAWRPTDDANPNNIWGFYCVDQDGDLVFAAKLDNPPTPLPDDLHQMSITLRLRPTSASIAGELG